MGSDTGVEMYVGRKSHPKIAQLLLGWHAERRGEKNTIWLSPTGAMQFSTAFLLQMTEEKRYHCMVCPKRESQSQTLV